MKISLSDRITLLKKEMPEFSDEACLYIAEEEYKSEMKENIYTVCFCCGLIGVAIGTLLGTFVTRYVIISSLAENAPQILPMVLKVINHGM